MTQKETAQQAIDRIVTDMTAAWNRHDVAAFGAAFAEDAEFTNVFGMVQRGRPEIEALHAPLFKTIFKDSVLTSTEIRLRMIRPDVAAVDVRWKMSGARNPMGEPWPEREGILNWVVTQHGDRWLIDVSHNMDLPPPELVKAQTALVKK
ncbi:MAG TPA: SgcJ/EcaC family oxidoreductase [Dongiaceae bacterium]|nr:SgcJ/EcaC family oxidoreductase [Dongiaceae bacterium]